MKIVEREFHGVSLKAALLWYNVTLATVNSALSTPRRVANGRKIARQKQVKVTDGTDDYTSVRVEFLTKTADPIPEPAAALLLTLGMMGFVRRRRVPVA